MALICERFNKEVKLLDCLACYFSKSQDRKGPGTCGFGHKYKAGDVLVKKTHDEPSVKILDIVADQYKFDCGDDFPHYEFFSYIDHYYELV